MLAIPIVLWLRSDGPPPETPQDQPSATTTAAVAAVALSSIALPQDCRLFDRGFWERPVKDGIAVTIRLTAAACAAATLDALSQSGRGIEVTWTLPSLGSASPVARAVLQLQHDPDGAPAWVGTVTFPEPGMWVADPRLGAAPFFQVAARDNGLVRRSPNLPFPAAPATIAVLNEDATKVVRTFPAERGGTGMLRSPDRAVFVQARDGGRWLVTGEVATGAVTPLFEVGAFANIVSAPDGRAMAVEWGTSNGRRELRIVTDAGKVTAIDDGTINPIGIEWAPDSSVLMADGDSRWVLGADGAVRDRRPSPDLGSAQIVWAPDSTYALLWYPGQQGRLVRFDRSSLDEQIVVVSSSDTNLAGFSTAPDGRRVAFAWLDSTGTSRVAIVAAEEVKQGVRLADWVIATFERATGSSVDFSGFGWSPDGRLLTFVRRIQNSGAQPRSEIGVIDAGTGEVRRVAQASDSYSGSPRFRAWSADGSLLFALRYNCYACEPSGSSVDVIDIAAGRVIESFEGSGYYGPTADGSAMLLSTPAGLLRTDGRTAGEVLVPFAGGIFFGSPIARLPESGGSGSSLAVQVSVGRGQQVFAARADGSAVDLLAVLGLGEPPSALIDATAAITRGDRRWERRSLSGGTTAPYIASGGALEKFEIALSPSRRLALDLDREGFAVLDVTAPAAAAVVARQTYPTGTQGTPAWSVDEKRVAFGNEYAIGVFDIESRSERVFEFDTLDASLGRSAPSERLWALTWTPSGAVEFATPKALWRLDISTGKAVKVIDAPRPGGFMQGTVLAYSPDGRTLAAATQYGVFALSGGGGWRQLSRVGVSPAERPGRTLHWAPDSSAVAYAGMSPSTPEGIVVAPLDGSGAYRLVAPGAGSVLGWLADGRVVWVAVTGGI